MHVCEVGGSSKSEVERWCVFSSALFAILSNKDKILSIFCVVEDHLHLEPAHNVVHVDDLTSTLCFTYVKPSFVLVNTFILVHAQ
jgi:cupin superfamily acireductone dioxygenase involved in methionine salvage